MFYDANAIKTGFNKLGDDALERHQAQTRFERAFGKGRRQQWLSKLTGRAQQLLSLADWLDSQSIRTQRYAGKQTIALDNIRGSENRVREFDIDFNPIADHIEQRWVGIAAAMLKGVALPPVDLIQVGDTYYVRDGHHRISVAKSFGQQDIEAIVTVITADC